MDLSFVAIATLGVALFCQELIKKLLQSILIYMTRGEFNQDNNETTPDEFNLLNPNTGAFTRCYIVQYNLLDVRWGFFVKEGFVYKKSSWLSWASFKDNRFPVPICLKENDVDGLLDILKNK